MSEINIKNLCVKYDNNTIIEQLDLRIPNGTFFTLLGPSGCGKTTLLRTLAGFIQPAAGELFFDDKNITRQVSHKRETGIVFQDYALFPHYSVYQNVAYGLKTRGEKKASYHDKVLEALDQVALTDYAERYPSELSGGQKQRVALARALVIKPKVLLMDEPLSNLDARLRIQMRQLICRLQKESNITTIFVTHDQEEALAMSDQIAVMEKGKIAQLGCPNSIYSKPASEYVARFIGSANILPADTYTAMTGDNAEAALADKTLVLRPEELRISATAAERSVPVRISEIQYLGYKTSFVIEHESLPEQGLNVDMLYPENLHNHQVGQTVFLQFPESIHCV